MKNWLLVAVLALVIFVVFWSQPRIDQSLPSSEPNASVQEIADKNHWVSSELVKDYIPRFVGILESRKDIAVRISQIDPKITTNHHQGEVVTSIHVGLKLRDDYTKESRKDFDEGMKSILQIWLSEFPLNDLRTIEIVATDSSGAVVSTISSEHREPATINF